MIINFDTLSVVKAKIITTNENIFSIEKILLLKLLEKFIG
tara:strand:- start:324 stop:443 length:120 start_codon:yes stop_codon:yes gene_type:complete